MELHFSRPAARTSSALGAFMPTPTSTRVLFLDDSGKPSPRDATKAVVIGGFSIPSAHVPALSRRIAGAKSRFYPDRGDPANWEIKSVRTVVPNAWRRSKNRLFLAEAMRILGELDCTVYTVSIDKRQLNHTMELQTTVPLQIQGLVEHFSVECTTRHETGLIVSDWSNHGLDAHASQSVGSFVISRRLPLHPTVYYANSFSSHPIQVADIIAAVRRRSIEGDVDLQPIDNHLATITGSRRIVATTHTGRPYTNRIVLI